MCVERPRMAVEAAPSSCRQVTGSSGATVTWIGPTDRRDVRALDRWCAGVGPAEVPHRRPAKPARPMRSPSSAGMCTSAGAIFRAHRQTLRAASSRRACRSPISRSSLQEAYRAGELVPAWSEADAAAPRRIRERPPGGERRDVATDRARGRSCVRLRALDAERALGCSRSRRSRERDSAHTASRADHRDRAAVRAPAASRDRGPRSADGRAAARSGL